LASSTSYNSSSQTNKSQLPKLCILKQNSCPNILTKHNSNQNYQQHRIQAKNFNKTKFKFAYGSSPFFPSIFLNSYISPFNQLSSFFSISNFILFFQYGWPKFHIILSIVKLFFAVERIHSPLSVCDLELLVGSF
jgi:hypothetical protein